MIANLWRKERSYAGNVVEEVLRSYDIGQNRTMRLFVLPWVLAVPPRWWDGFFFVMYMEKVRLPSQCCVWRAQSYTHYRISSSVLLLKEKRCLGLVIVIYLVLPFMTQGVFNFKLVFLLGVKREIQIIDRPSFLELKLSPRFNSRQVTSWTRSNWKPTVLLAPTLQIAEWQQSWHLISWKCHLLCRN